MLISNPNNVNTTPIANNNGTLVARDRREQESQKSDVRELNEVNATVLSTSELVERGELKQQERVQRIVQNESASFSAQQGIAQYQQTVEAAKAFEGGELVGIDLYA